MKPHLTIFGDGNPGFRAAGKRLYTQSLASKLFSEINLFNFSALKVDQKIVPKTVIEFMKDHKKGFGYWIWKPYLLLHALNNVNDNQIVCILDAGCQLNLTKTSITRWNWYVDFTKKHNSLFMQINPGSFDLNDVSDRAWCKRELLVQLKLDNNPFVETPQIQSGIIFLKKNDLTVKLAREWVQLSTLDNFKLLISPSDRSLEDSRYIEHRWEQSILSLLIKKYGFSFISDETYFAPSWKDGKDYPIWTMRNRSGGDAYRRNLLDLTKIAFARLTTNCP